jgi:CRP-like cAMP-binding protein
MDTPEVESTFALKNVTMFSQLSDKALTDVAKALKLRKLAAGEILFNQGDPGHELIIVKEGGVAIFVPTPGAPGGGQAIRIFQPGEMLGEMALIDRKPRSASARAEAPSTILALGEEDFQSILAENPEMALSVMAGLSDRIRYTTDFLGEVRGWVRRVAEGHYQTSGGMEIDQFKDKTMVTLAAEFAQMAARVQEREEILRKEVIALRIEIDETKRKQDGEKIMGSDYYKNLKERARLLRKTD